jgi:hypothetical protein
MAKTIVAIEHGRCGAGAPGFEIRRPVDPPAAQNSIVVRDETYAMAIDAKKRRVHDGFDSSVCRAFARASRPEDAGHPCLQEVCRDEETYGHVFR